MNIVHKSLLVLLLNCVALQIKAQQAPEPKVWVATWSASQQVPEVQNSLPADDMKDVTLRQVFHVSVGGSAVRVHFANTFGGKALHIVSAHIARPLSSSTSSIDPKSDRALTFAGDAEVTIPPGAEFLSDPVQYSVSALSDLAVSFYAVAAPDTQTGHPGSRSTSYYVHGNAVDAPVLDKAKTIEHWYQVSAIDVETNSDGATVVALGDSITDGHGSTTDGNDRWTDALARRLSGSVATHDVGVSNEGIGGNHLLTDGLGPNALSRFDRDVLAPAGVRWVIVFEGINDLGGLEIKGETTPEAHARIVHDILAAYVQIIVRAHARGLRVYGGTITPDSGSGYYHPGPLDEADRQAVNRWIRTSGAFDSVIDFDAVVRDPQHPDRLLPADDCGDHLHPSPAGYKAMAEAIPLRLFEH